MNITLFSNASTYHKPTTVISALMLFLSINATTMAVPQSGTAPLLTVKHNLSSDPFHAKREQYYFGVLQLALNKSGIPFKRQVIILDNQTETRAADLIARGRFDVHWLNTSNELEEKLLPIRIPLFKGLIGWRILTIHESQQDTFKKITTLEQLKTLTALQGNDWPDTKLLKSQGFNVETAREFRSLLRMLQHGHGDFFPRGITEIWNEQSVAKKMNLVVEQNLAIQYPAAYYFFVAKTNLRLKNAIEKGLNIAIADGSFNQIFHKHFGELLTKAKLNKRTVFTIPNPLLPPQTPLNQEELWLRPEDTTPAVKEALK